MTAKAEILTWLIRAALSVLLYFATKSARELLDYMLQFFDLTNWALISIRLVIFIIWMLLIIIMLRWLNQYLKGKGIHLDSFDA